MTEINRTMIKDLSGKKGEEVIIKGWADTVRAQGKMAFFDFRDISGKVQGVVFGKPEVLEIAKTIKPEYVLAVKGIVNERNDRGAKEAMEKEKETGIKDFFIKEVEIEITGIEILNEAETPVFDISKKADTREINEETRLKYRYLDLRSDRMRKNILMRHKVALFVRNYLSKVGFMEIETPLFTKSTPEGARDFLVPSRLHQGKFFALPQSPQQYKQLLMAGGMEKYFQFAKSMRDEDLRGDRQPEFTQMDLEMSFAREEDVMNLIENLLIDLVKELYPEKRIQEIPFPRIPYAEAMEKYGNDRPDLREDKNDPNLLAFAWIVDFPFFEKTEDSDDPQAQGEWTFTHNPFSMPKEKDLEKLMKKENIVEITAAQYDIVLNGFEIGGGSVRSHKAEILETILDILGHSKENIEKNFGHMLSALRKGTPPHAGIAWGFDRLMMLLQNEPNIREVIAFPKTREARDPMLEAPSEVSKEQLDELGIELKKKD